MDLDWRLGLELDLSSRVSGAARCWQAGPDHAAAGGARSPNQVHKQATKMPY
jgi:hypothetical protein